MTQYSFFKWNGFSPDMKFVGLDNYKTVFTNPDYFSVFNVSVYYFFATFIQMGLALYFATLLTFSVKAKNFFKGALFFPFLLNGVAIAFIFLYYYKPEETLDSIMIMLGLEEYIK